MQINTARLLLRDFTQDDAPAVYSFDSQQALSRYRGGGVATEEDTRAFIQRTQQWLQQDPRPNYAFAIILKGQAQMIGIVGLIVIRPDHREAELWYRLDQHYWGQGYTTEAAQAMLSFGFTQLGLHRISAVCHPDNIGSFRVMEKIGMQYEGRMRENFLNKDGTWRDSLFYAAIQSEF